MEGAFVFISPTERIQDDIRKHRHLFFSSSLPFQTGESGSPRASTLREAFTAVRHRSRGERRPSVHEIAPHAGPSSQAYSFAFDIPRPAPSKPGQEMPQEMPPTFSTMSMGEIGMRGRTGVERAEVEYVIIAQWEGPDPNERVR